MKILGLASTYVKYPSGSLSYDSKQNLSRYKKEILSRVMAGEAPTKVASDIAVLSGVSPDQVLLYIYQEVEGD